MEPARQKREYLLRQNCYDFCQALVGGTDPSQLLQDFFAPDKPNAPTMVRRRITEHGPAWASSKLPFLGTTFVGTTRCEEYFTFLAHTLAFEADSKTFPPLEGFIVDIDARRFDDHNILPLDQHGVVHVEGRATFRSLQTNRSWKEKFMYRLSGFDEKGKFTHWEIWADPLSAWNAVVNEPLIESEVRAGNQSQS